MQVDEAGLRDFLIDSGTLSRRQLSDIGETNAPLYDTLLSRGIISQDELRRAVAGVSGVPFVVLGHDDIATEALLYIPEPIARTHNLAGFRVQGGDLEVALLDLEDLSAITFLQEERGVRILPRLTTADSLKRALIAYHKHLKEKFADSLRSKSDPIGAADALLAHAMLHRASAIHISAREFPRLAEDSPRFSEAGVESRRVSGQGELLVRYRINGKMFDAMTLPREAAGIIERFKELANISLTLPTPQEGSFRARSGVQEEMRVRVSTMPNMHGERAVLQLTPVAGTLSRKGFTLESLGFHGESLESVYRTLSNSSGLVLVEGSEGSGKTTTLYTLLDILSTPHRLLATIEEHIGLHLPHTEQMEVRPEIGLTMDAGLRAILKQDPHVVMIDSIRDTKTAALAASAASRGAFVLAGTQENFKDAGAKMLLRTRVVGKVCQNCKENYHLSRTEAAPFDGKANFGRVLTALKEEGIISNEVQWKDLLFSHAVGCTECDSGFTGALGLQEVEVGGKIAGLTLAEDGLFKVIQGLTTIEEVTRAIEA
ncbi:Flp pilus assembly complex ATPase component TadA [Acetobacteraceae bacterium]|nr:Flp pilus assembly complex ATPase component TadA [Candidatus Parcubacteria bacterium]